MKRLDKPIKARNLEQICFKDHWFDKGFMFEIIIIDKQAHGIFVYVRHAGVEDGWYPAEYFDFIPDMEEKVS